jgi:hypothetical protein
MISSILDHKTNEKFYLKFGGKIHLAIYRIIMSTTKPPLLPSLPFKDLHWAGFPGYFNDRSIRRVHRYLDEIQFAGLCQ